MVLLYVWSVGVYLRFHSSIVLGFLMKMIFRLDDRHSHIMKIKKIIEMIEIYEPVEETIFHAVNESE